MKSVQVFSLTLFFLILFVSSQHAQIGADTELTSFSKIESELLSQKIDIDTWAAYMVYALYDPVKLPAEYRSNLKEKCAAWVLDILAIRWNDLSEQTKELLYRYGFNSKGGKSRPAGLNSTQESDHFVFHYSVAAGDSNAVSSYDGNSNGIPDFVDKIIDAYDHSWRKEIDTMGYTAPPPDSGRGGNDKYDIYILKISGSTYGITHSELPVLGDNPNSVGVIEKNAVISYITMRNEYDNYSVGELGAIRVTAAHEFFHAIHNAYDVYEKTWMKEATSTWMEDEVYDNVNDSYLYLKSWFKIPWAPLDATSSEMKNHWYGSFIFFKYISEHFGGADLIKEMWERSIVLDSHFSDQSFTVIDDVLTNHGSNYGNVFLDFIVANLVKDTAPYNYEEGANYPEIFKDLLFNGSNTMSFSLTRRSSIYGRIPKNIIPIGPDKIEIIFTNNDSFAIFNVQFITRTNNTVNNYRKTPGPGVTTYIFDNSNQFDSLYVIVSRLSENGLSGDFKIKIQNHSKLVPVVIFDNTLLSFDMSPHILGWHTVPDLKFTFLADEKQYYSILEKYALAANSNELIVCAGSNYSYNDYILYAYSGGNFTQLNLTQYDSSNDPPQFWISYLDVTPQIDTGFAWFAGTKYVSGANGDEGLWRMKISDKSVSKINNDRLQYNEPLIVDGAEAAWLFEDISQSKTFIKHFKNGSANNVYSLSYNDPLSFNPGVFDFDKNIIVWKEEGWTPNGAREKIVAYDLSDFSLFDVDTTFDNDGVGNLLPMAKTNSGRILWTKAVPILSLRKVYLWEAQSTKQLYAGDYWTDISLQMENIDIDESGAAWLEWGWDSYGQPTLKFYYYEFSSHQTMEAVYGGGLGLQFNTTSWNGDFRIHGDEFVFSAYDQNTSKIGLYRFKMKEVIASAEDQLGLENISYSLLQNYPNPFNPTTRIKFSIPAYQKVELNVYDILGRKIKTLIDRELEAGIHGINFNGNNLASGVYFYRIVADEYTRVKKMLLIK